MFTTQSSNLCPALINLIFSAAISAAQFDLDNDGLRNEVESNTGVYISPTDTGTSPTVADSDGDSLPDGMELTLGTNPVDTASRVKRPNIIYILVDDLGYGDVGCFWQNQRTGSGIWKIQTPRLDAMATEGAMLTHHYVGAPVCAGSRGSFLQGQHQGHAGVRGTQFDKALPNNHSISSVLNTAGYKTVHLGKAGLAGTSFDSSKSSVNLSAHPLKRGFDEFFGYLTHADGINHYPRNGAEPYKSYLHIGYTPVTDAYQDLYTTDAWTAYAKKTIINETRNHPERPFFIYLSFSGPHFDAQFAPTATYPTGGGTTGGLQWTGAPSYVNTAINDPARINNSANRHPAVGSNWYSAAQKYASMVRRIDDSVGDILQTLRDMGVEQDTLVIFTSDNGPTDKEVYPPTFQSYGPFEGLKFDLWEGGIRVPTIAWWPGKLQGTNQPANIRRISQPVGNWDWMATFAEMAKIPVPAFTDGRSLVPAFLGQPDSDTERFLYFEFNYGGFTSRYPDFPNHGGENRGEMQAVRIGDFMGVRYNMASVSDRFRVYDVVNDPKQNRDLSFSLPDIEKRMQAIAINSRRKTDGITRFYDTALMPDVPVEFPKKGLRWKSYEGYWPLLPEFRTLSEVTKGYASKISPAQRSREIDVGLAFSGYIKVPTAGSYQFRLDSNSSACMWVHEARIIENDFNHVPSKSSDPVYLESGFHPIRLYYRHQTGTPTLKLSYSGPGIPLQEISESSYYIDGAITVPIAETDRDGDGSTDAEELIAGTNPDDLNSYLHIRSISREMGAIWLRWTARAGRTYHVQESSDLSSWKPVPFLDELVVTSRLTDAIQIIPENGDSSRFFRILVSLTPRPPDQDGDGSPDIAEAVAGTDPNDPQSFFRIHKFTKSEDSISLRWSSVAGRTYKVEESHDLKTWRPVPGLTPLVVTSTQPDATLEIPSNGDPNYYVRMQVTLTPTAD